MSIAVDEMRLQIADVLMQLQLIITRVKICIETLDEYSLEISKVKVLLEFDSDDCHLEYIWIILLHLFHLLKDPLDSVYILICRFLVEIYALT